MQQTRDLRRTSSDSPSPQSILGGPLQTRGGGTSHLPSVAEITYIDHDAEGPRYVVSQRKRALDIAFAGSALFFFLPLMLIVAAAVWLSSPGPVFFRQSRTGQNGRIFKIFKFRTMYVVNEHESQIRQAARGDDRITPIGRYLRLTSLDELPQFLNVLKGDMAVVGPRPHAVAHDTIFARQADHYYYRFAARPGVTGLAQVSGSRGATPTAASVIERTQYDLAYIKTASLRLDFNIILATAKEVFLSRSAY